MTVHIRSCYSEHVKVTIECDPDERRTKDEFQHECNINHIMANWLRTGEPPKPPMAIAQFGDFSQMRTYQDALDQVLAAGHAFAALPIRIRQRFANSAPELLAFLERPENLAEAIALGIVADPDVKTPPTGLIPPVTTPPATPPPATPPPAASPEKPAEAAGTISSP